MELSKLSVHLSIVRGCCEDVHAGGLTWKVETMFPSYIVMATAKDDRDLFATASRADPLRASKASKISEAKDDN
jgi:hypothetical protein